MRARVPLLALCALLGATDGAEARPRTARAVAPPPTGSIEEQLSAEIDAVWRGRILRRGVTAIYVVDARTGDELYAVHADDPLNPASNVKLVATATALDVLGPAWRYHTRLYGPTPSAGGVVAGDLYLLGNYDPTLAPDHLGELAAALARRGVREIRGDLVVGTDGRRDSVGRPEVAIAVTGTRPGQPPRVTVTPATDLIEIQVVATTARGRRARLSVDWSPPPAGDGARPPDRLTLTVGGSARAGRTRTYRRRVPERVRFTAHLLRAALADAGVSLRGEVREAPFDDYVRAAARGPTPYLPVELARHQSAPLARLVARINKRSVNWLADAILRTAGAAACGGPPSMASGVRAMESWLEREAGVPRGAARLDTGSGLSYHSALSARQIIQVLRAAAGYAPRAAADATTSSVFLDSLAVAGRDGTLRGRFHDSRVAGRMRGKTGTLNRILALSGIVSAAGDDALLFAIITNGHPPALRRRIRREHEAIVVALYRYLERRRTTAANR